jgi:hypothetical protein
MYRMTYKGYEITAGPMLLADSGRWDTMVHILLDRHGEVKNKTLTGLYTFETEAEAIHACFYFSRQIIDSHIAI